MKRWTLRLFVFLLLGAIVNIAVAWGLARQSEESFERPGTRIALGVSAPTEDCWFVVMTSRLGRFQIHASPMWPERKAAGRRLGHLESDDFDNVSSLLPPWSALHEAPPMREASYRVVEQVRGWPMLGMRAEYRYWSDRAGSLSVKHGFDVTPRSGVPMWPIILPAVPVWPGFAINTLFYAAVLWVAFLVPGGVKRLRRRLRGVCIHCGYDLRGHRTPGAESTKCPECGGMVLGKRMGLLPPATPADQP